MAPAPPTGFDALATLTGLNEEMEALDRIAVAEAAITAASQRQPHAENQLFHSLRLLFPTSKSMEYDNGFYAAHCRELCQRITAGADTRPGTAVEVICALSDVSKTAPLSASGTGLMMRMWLACGLPDVAEIASSSKHYEALHRARIDDHEDVARRMLSRRNRILGDIECEGLHHGRAVTCAYAPPLGAR